MFSTVVGAMVEGRGGSKDDTFYSFLILQVGDQICILRKSNKMQEGEYLHVNESEAADTLGIQGHKQHRPEKTWDEKSNHCYLRGK